MTTARREIFSPEESGVFHCISRCVRRAFLCGVDSYSGRSYEHRKVWVKHRLTELLEIFAIDCLAYAIMSNHIHLLLRNLPELVRSWTDEEVARRWRLLFPRRRKADGTPEEPNEVEIQAITANQELVAKYRLRLSDISWFNRCLNEKIAKRANAEDECKGRFFEGRFKSIKLETPEAVLACSVYVDLKPIRAGVAKTLHESDFTSVQDRIRTILTDKKLSAPRLASHRELCFSDISPQSYVRLVEETGKTLVNNKATLDPAVITLLTKHKIRPDGWITNAKDQGRLFRRVIGSIKAIRQFAKLKDKPWFQGIGAAKILFSS